MSRWSNQENVPERGAGNPSGERGVRRTLASPLSRSALRAASSDELSGPAPAERQLARLQARCGEAGFLPGKR